MAKPRSTQAKLDRLKQLRDASASPDLLRELRALLADRSNFVVAEAAALVGKSHLAELAKDVVAAFERFLIEPEETDKLCAAKMALVEALEQIDHEEAGVFLAGVRHVQLEPAWGGSQDTAAPLRAACAAALVRIDYPEVLTLLVDLLADPEKIARAGAVRALVGKARAGDAEPEVTGECLTGLLRLEPAASVPVVAEFLEAHDEAIQEVAVMALAESRRPEAFAVLKAFWEGYVPEDLREIVLMALAMMRLPAATDYLLSLVADAPPKTAAMAVSALAIHRYDERLRERIAAIVTRRSDKN
ncbi:MAG: HEAT repeat domain-containing protein, partial [Planctomycetota bacterium]